MKQGILIGKYEYSKWTATLASTLFIAGIIYGISQKKGAWGTFGTALIGSLTGFGIGMLIKAPKRVIE